jgi:glycerate 2-kinase
MRILLAPDKFKGSLTAPEVADALAEGLSAAIPDVEIDRCPIADGGEGTVDAAVAAGFRRVAVEVTGPTGKAVTAAYAVRGQTAVIEMAAASGLQLLPGGEPAPLTATSFGTGQLVTAALDAGARTIILGIGGSACTDGGAGLVTALGARLLDRGGRPLSPGGAALADLVDLDITTLHPAIAGAAASPVRIVLASDVGNPLLGATGAAAVYGPQKGATEDHVALLDAALTNWADTVERATGQRHRDDPGAGAAGGAGFAALALLNATMRPGIDVLLELHGFADRLRRADLVITGEGRLDTQTLHGKGPAGVAASAARHGLPVFAVAGQVTIDVAALTGSGITRAYALAELEPDSKRCITNARQLVIRTAERLASDWPLTTANAASGQHGSRPSGRLG